VVVLAVIDRPDSDPVEAGSQRWVAAAMAQASGRPRRNAFVVIRNRVVIAVLDANGPHDVRATLHAFVEADLSVAATASALSLHPNSLRYRLGRITELTGRDLLELIAAA